MKFLADVNVEKAVVDFLTESGHDVKWVADYDCQMSDEALLNMAQHEQRILLTNDKDFGTLAFRQKKLAAGIILLRVKGQLATDKVKLLDKLLRRHGDRLSGNLVVLSMEKIRITSWEDPL